MQLIFGIIIGLFILMSLVIAHEFGHFMMARKNGVKVKEFGICFPPRAAAWVRKEIDGKKKWVKLPKSEWGKPQDDLILSINWLPIGGFCSMDGESDADKRKGTFGAASFLGKTKILFGGVLMNWLVAAILLTILALVGMPQFIPHQFYLGQDADVVHGGVSIDSVLEDSPAAKAGLQTGDRITAIDEQEITFPSDVTAYGDEHRGETVQYTIYRKYENVEVKCFRAPCEPQTFYSEETIPVTLNSADAEYALGIQMAYGQSFVRSTWSAPIVGVGATLQLTGETFKGLGVLVWDLISGLGRQLSFDSNVRQEGQAALGAAGDSVSGPVGIIGVIFPAFASTGARNLTFLAALISISLACMNVLPIPALDGGRWLLIAIYRLRRKTLTKETEEKIVSRAFMILLGLIALITILDIIKLF